MRRSRSSGIDDAGQRDATLGDGLAHHPLEDRDQQVVLAVKVEIDGAGGDAGDARDVGHLGAEEAALGEDADGGAQDGVALVGRAAAAGSAPRCATERPAGRLVDNEGFRARAVRGIGD